MTDYIKLDEIITSIFERYIEQYRRNYIFLINIETVCKQHNINFKNICNAIQNKQEQFIYTLETYYKAFIVMQINAVLHVSDDDYKSNRFYEKLENITNIPKKDIDKIFEKRQIYIWSKFYKELTDKKIDSIKPANISETGPYKYVRYPKNQIIFTLYRTQDILRRLCPFTNYSRDAIKMFLQSYVNKNISNVQLIKKYEDYKDFAVEQIYAYYKTFGIPTKQLPQHNIEKHNKKQNTNTIYIKTRPIIMLFDEEAEESPRFYIDEDYKDISLKDVIKNIGKNEKILLFYRERRIAEWEYTKYLSENNEYEYSVIIPKQYIYLFPETKKLAISEQYMLFFCINNKNILYAALKKMDMEDNIIGKSAKNVYLQGGIKSGYNSWLKGYGPTIYTDSQIFINGKESNNNYLENAPAGEYYIVCDNYDKRIIIVDYTINNEYADYNGWLINKKTVMPNNEDWNLKGLLIHNKHTMSFTGQYINECIGIDKNRGNTWIIKHLAE